MLSTRHLAIAIPAALLLGACGLAPSAGAGGRVEVVAGENSWGSIAAELGGDRVHVTSIISNPATDPHAYEARPDDARTVAQARYVIVNGAGYDPWLPKLLDANPVSGRAVLDIGGLVGRRPGDNPHLWYSPAYVDRVVDRVTADLKALAPADAAYFDQRHQAYATSGLKQYRETLGAIRQRYAGVPVGATESIFAYLADAAGLRLVTPPGYMKAVSEGSDASAADKAAVDQQVATRAIRVLVFNSQNTTPDVNAVVDHARARGIAVTSVTETLAPAGASFADWQTTQLRSLLQALGG